jgi:hypothetical protein
MAGSARAQLYQTYEFDGRKVTARPIAYKDAYIQLALQGGGYTNVPWGRLSTATLRMLRTNRFAALYVAPYFDPPPMSPPQGPRITVKPVERMDRPTSGGLFASPVMWLIFFVLYLTNIYAGYEIALFRAQNRYLVAGLSAVAPVLAPIVFLSLPTREEEAPAEEQAVEGAEVAAEAAPAEAAAAEAVPAPAAAAAAPSAPAHKPSVVFQRGQYTFNRRFFETKMAGFLKMVPGEAEKDMVIVVNSARGTHVGLRFTRLSPNELTLHVVKGNASQDVIIPYTEVSQVTIRHKDAAG